MNKYSIIALFLFCSVLGYGQNNLSNVEEGDVFTLGTAVTPEYKHIDFPRRNFILKRGAIANFNKLKGEKVVVHKVSYNNENEAEVVLKRLDGKRFFRFFPTVKANFDRAMESGELIQ